MRHIGVKALHLPVSRVEPTEQFVDLLRQRPKLIGLGRAINTLRQIGRAKQLGLLHQVLDRCKAAPDLPETPKRNRQRAEHGTQGQCELEVFKQLLVISQVQRQPCLHVFLSPSGLRYREFGCSRTTSGYRVR